ncbi:heterokaryon incompatibility [Coniochaeta sp. 2T2.1]|nr:heterokaryon incompatibility [Coniochaeta sp. 2T2.1]
MRLLNTHTLQLELFEGGPKLSYAILSHTWGDDEVTYQDLVTGRGPERKAAWSKITSCCARARMEGYGYVWIDTCCIDKSSSAELSEAINSMFRFYQEAEVCYAYLADVHLVLGLDEAEDEELEGVQATGGIALVGSVAAALQRSRWFTRGWTLQELRPRPNR